MERKKWERGQAMSDKKENPKVKQSTDRSDKGKKQVKSEKIRYENADEIYK
jgi:hypothetical protein